MQYNNGIKTQQPVTRLFVFHLNVEKVHTKKNNEYAGKHKGTKYIRYICHMLKKIKDKWGLGKRGRWDKCSQWHVSLFFTEAVYRCNNRPSCLLSTHAFTATIHVTFVHRAKWSNTLDSFATCYKCCVFCHYTLSRFATCE